MYEILSLVFVGLMWGGTNPLIKRNSKDILKVKANTKIIQFLLELKYLLTNFQYLWPMAINQMGSLLYFVTLQSADLTLSVPIANSLTFVFTAIVGQILGEKIPGSNTILGIISILFGTYLCCMDKLM